MKVIKFKNRGKIIVYGKQSKLITPKITQPVPEHITFLNNVLTNDIKNLKDKQFNYNLMLSDKGYPVADFFIYRMGDKFLMDFEKNTEDMIDKLDKLKLSLKVYFENVSFHHYFVFGEGCENFIKTNFDVEDNPENFEYISLGEVVIAKNPLRLGVSGFDILSKKELNIQENITEEEFENLRVKNCVPKLNRELKEGVIPLETNIWKYAISFNKGCYTGQEVIARIFYRGRPPRKMVKLKLEGYVSENSNILYEGKKVGVLTSISKDLDGIGFILNAYIDKNKVYNSDGIELKLISECEDLLN